MITIYTDGSCLTNPGNGGWAAIINDGEEIKKISGNEKNTTNNSCLLYTSPSPRDLSTSRMPSSA